MKKTLRVFFGSVFADDGTGMVSQISIVFVLMQKMVAVRIALLLLTLAVGETDSFSPQLSWRLAVVPSATRLSVSSKPSTCDQAVSN